MNQDDGLAVLILIATVFGVVWTVLGAVMGSVLRGRPGAGALLGFLFGPLGLILLFLFQDERAKCFQCQTVIRDKAFVCHCCGADIRPAKPPMK